MELKKNSFLYNSFYIQKLINSLSIGGKKQKIEKHCLKCFFNLKFKLKRNPLYLYMFVLMEIRPYLELKSLRLGSMVYQIPVPLVWSKQICKAIKLLVRALRGNKTSEALNKKLSKEIYAILGHKSSILKQNQQVYKVASSNRAFAHFRW